jgi:hypothetical protein
MTRHLLLAVSLMSMMLGCGGVVKNLGLNEFCERDANCAAGLTCDPKLVNVCFFGDCVDTVSGSACCEPQYLLLNNCCAPPRQIVNLVGGGKACSGSPGVAVNP